MAIVKMQEAGLTPSGLTTAQGSASARKANTELTLPDGTKVAGNALDPEMLAARKTFEKEALLQNKASGAMDGPIRNRGEQEWDTFLVSFSREEMARMDPQQMQDYANTVIETMASGASNNRAGQKMYFKQEMHMDTNNAHVYFGIHRHAIEMTAAKPTISPTIDLKDKSEAAAAAEAVNQALAEKGFAKLDNWINWNGVSLYGDLRTPDSAKEAAASQLEKLGVEELPPSLKTGTPDHTRASAEQVLERIRARDTDMVALEQAEKIKAKELADLNAAAEKVAAEVAAINAAKLAVQDKLDALALRDTATAERDAAVQARDEALTVRDSALAERDTAVAERDSAVQSKGEAEAQRDAALAESEAKGHEVVRLAEELRERGLLIEGMTNDHAAEVEELQGKISERDAELKTTREMLLEASRSVATESAKNEALTAELRAMEEAKAAAEAETRRIVAEMTAEREQFKKILEQQGALMARSEAQLKDADEQMRALRDELRTQREEQSRALVEARRDANEQAREIQRLREELAEVKAAKPEQAAPSADEPAPPAGSTAGGRALKGDIEKLERLREQGKQAGKESGPKNDDDLNK